MILDEVVLENFGVFAGRQSITLTPKGKKRRVVLVGGLNGRGKTTLLDAVQLALYGNRARISNRGSLSYESYISRARSRGISDQETFAVELAFSVHDSQGPVQYRVRRVWRQSNQGFKEILEVSRDGERDRALTETWSEHVEELLPLEIASLFFFDGEKIESLANPTQASGVISAAVTGLLGLGVIERLQRDLLVIERRKQDDIVPQDESYELQALAEAVASAESAVSLAVQKCASEQTNVDRIERELREAEEAARRDGGEAYERRHELELLRNSADSEVGLANSGLRELASGVLPLAICRNLVFALSNESARASGLNGEELVTFLAQRDSQLFDQMTTMLEASTLQLVADLFEQDRDGRRRASQSSDRYRPSLTAVRAADAALEQLLTDQQTLKEILEDRIDNLDLAADFDRQLAGVPSGELISKLITDRDALRLSFAEASGRLAVLTEEAQEAERLAGLAQAELEKVRQSLAMAQMEGKDAGRILEHSAKVRTTLDLLKDEVRRRSIRRIETEVLKCFKKLLGKENLISTLSLDVETCEPELTTKDGLVIHMERLSAGERQLFAVSMLWGLAIVSGRQLPTIIDTPLGRLDGVHRLTLVERYFPNAADQVILLSTDKEINRDLADRLESSTGRWYHLEYLQEEQRTIINEGYLFEGADDVA